MPTSDLGWPSTTLSGAQESVAGWRRQTSLTLPSMYKPSLYWVRYLALIFMLWLATLKLIRGCDLNVPVLLVTCDWRFLKLFFQLVPYTSTICYAKCKSKHYDNLASHILFYKLLLSCKQHLLKSKVGTCVFIGNLIFINYIDIRSNIIQLDSSYSYIAMWTLRRLDVNMPG